MNNPDIGPCDLATIADSELHAFRIADEVQIVNILEAVRDSGIAVNISCSDGRVYVMPIRAIDRAQRRIIFTIDIKAPSTPHLLEADEAVAVCFLEQIKIQFDVSNRMLVHGDQCSVMQGTLPKEIYRFQRRKAFRVPTIDIDSPVARFRHPTESNLQLEMRILDLSASGCAVLVSNGIPPIASGSLIKNASLQLDSETAMTASIIVRSITSAQTLDGTRLGCELLDMSRSSEGLLLNYINQVQRRLRRAIDE